MVFLTENNNKPPPTVLKIKTFLNCYIDWRLQINSNLYLKCHDHVISETESYVYTLSSRSSHPLLERLSGTCPHNRELWKHQHELTLGPPPLQGWRNTIQDIQLRIELQGKRNNRVWANPFLCFTYSQNSRITIQLERLVFVGAGSRKTEVL